MYLSQEKSNGPGRVGAVSSIKKARRRGRRNTAGRRGLRRASGSSKARSSVRGWRRRALRPLPRCESGWCCGIWLGWRKAGLSSQHGQRGIGSVFREMLAPVVWLRWSRPGWWRWNERRAAVRWSPSGRRHSYEFRSHAVWKIQRPAAGRNPRGLPDVAAGQCGLEASVSSAKTSRLTTSLRPMRTLGGCGCKSRSDRTQPADPACGPSSFSAGRSGSGCWRKTPSLTSKDARFRPTRRGSSLLIGLRLRRS